jgi:hypothetical protein
MCGPQEYPGDELSYRLPVCAFVYRVRDCKHPVPAIYINDTLKENKQNVSTLNKRPCTDK